MTVTPATHPGARTRPIRAARRPVPPGLTRLLLIVALLVAWQILVIVGVLDRTTVPAPTDCLPKLFSVLGNGEFWSDAGRTAQTTLAAFAAATAVGLVVGTQLARFPVLARILEPYLVGAYAIPVIVFYPTLLVIFGLGTGPIIVTAFLGAVVPVILTTTVALAQQSTVHRKLARSLRCSPMQTITKVTFPSVLPLLLPGLKLAFIYSMASTVGVEFIVADAGLGYRIGQLYRDFDTVDMYVYIIALFLLALLINQLLNLVERTVRKDLQ